MSKSLLFSNFKECNKVLTKDHYHKFVMAELIGERAKRARHSQVCSIENRGYIIYIYYIYIVRANFVLITRKEGGA